MLFEQTCMWLENDISIHSVQEFRRKMIEICKEEDKDKVYDAQYIKKSSQKPNWWCHLVQWKCRKREPNLL